MSHILSIIKQTPTITQIMSNDYFQDVVFTTTVIIVTKTTYIISSPYTIHPHITPSPFTSPQKLLLLTFPPPPPFLPPPFPPNHTFPLTHHLIPLPPHPPLTSHSPSNPHHLLPSSSPPQSHSLITTLNRERYDNRVVHCVYVCLLSLL